MDSSPHPATKQVAQPVPSRFVLERVQIVSDDLAYNNERGVYILRDTQTGQDYIGVSGIGITELGDHRSGKMTVQDER